MSSVLVSYSFRFNYFLVVPIYLFFAIMCFCFTFLIFLFFPLIGGNNTSTTKIMEISNSTMTSPKSAITTASDSNTTKILMLSEGGSVLPDLPKLPILYLPKENHTSLINLDKEVGKQKEKSIVPRKGVIYNPLEDTHISNNITSHKDRIDTSITPKIILNNTASTVKSLLQNSSNENSKGMPINITISNTTHTPEIVKKPLILSYGAHSAGDIKTEKVKSKIESSPKSIITDQLPSPNVKVSTSTTRHPGMIMPVVITMLVVPMFAVLGYLALRRGREAWKNRHYKRMDFLLDGMYNE